MNSALQRARATVEERLPEQSQQETLRSIGDEELRELVSATSTPGSAATWRPSSRCCPRTPSSPCRRCRSWFHTREPIREFLGALPDVGRLEVEGPAHTASGQPALGFYTWDDDEGAYLPFALNVLTFRGREISDVTAYINRTIEPEERERYHRWVDEATDERAQQGAVRGLWPADAAGRLGH